LLLCSLSNAFSAGPFDTISSCMFSLKMCCAQLDRCRCGRNLYIYIKRNIDNLSSSHGTRNVWSSCARCIRILCYTFAMYIIICIMYNYISGSKELLLLSCRSCIYMGTKYMREWWNRYIVHNIIYLYHNIIYLVSICNMARSRGCARDRA